MKYIIAIIAGLCMTFQGVFNTRLSEKVGLWEANTFVQGTAFIFTLIMLFILGKGSFSELPSCNKIYLTGGFLGMIIILTVMLSFEALNPTVAVGVILVSQLTSAGLVDAFGLFDSELIQFSIFKIGGFLLMLSGIILFSISK